MNVSMPTLPKIDFEKLNLPTSLDPKSLFETVDEMQTKALDQAESLTNAAVKRLPIVRLPLADRLPSLETISSEWFNRASKIQSANRVFVKRVVFGEEVPTPAAAKASTPKVSTPKVSASKAKTTKAAKTTQAAK